MLTFFHPAEVQRDFARAADSYDTHAALQREVLAGAAEKLAEYIPQGTVLDAGCGTGNLAVHAISGWSMFAIDIAAPMCARAKARGMPAACADVTSLPFIHASADALICSLVLQWLNDRKQAFKEFRRVVRPGGYVAATIFGPETLKELKHVLNGRVSEFPTLEQFLNDAEGWQPVEAESRIYEQHYSSFFDLMFSLKAIGASNKRAERRRGLTTPGTFRRAEEQYRESFGKGKGIVATWQVHTLVLK